MKQTVFILTPVLFLLAACTPQSRGEKWAQGQGNDLLEVSAFQNRKATLTTNGVKDATDAQMTASYTKEKKIVSAKKERIATFQPAQYTTTSAELKKDLLLKINPNQTFTLLYKVDDKYLKIFLIADPQDVDQEMLTYAEKDEGDKVAVPLMGYPIKGFFRTETARNDNEEPTKHKIEVGVSSLEQATYFRVDWNAYEVFQAILKSNVFKASYFRGEWFESETVVGAPEKSSSELGAVREQQSFVGTSIVKFAISDTSLKVLNLNIDDRIAEQAERADLNLTTLLTIPAKTVDYQKTPSGRSGSLKEESREDLEWNQKRFVSLDFNSTVSAAVQNAATQLTDLHNQLVALEVTDNYFAFTLQESLSNKRVKIAFLRVAPTNFKKKRIHANDMKKFGYYVTQKSVFVDHKISREEDYYRNSFLNRFNVQPSADGQPASIIFHLTKNSPDWTYPIAQKAVESWNSAFAQAFEKTGNRVNIVLAENSDRQELGDIRYNHINMVESLAGGSLLGLGPSLANSRTGEIISATSNIHITPLREDLIGEIRSFVRSRRGQLTPNYIPGLAILYRTVEAFKDTEVEGEVPNTGAARAIKADLTQPLKKSPLPGIKLGRLRDYTISSKNIISDIEKLCPEVKSYIGSLPEKDSPIATGRELVVVEGCAQKLVGSRILSTLVHEMGHNFGLVHNFAGSTDKANFYPAAPNAEQIRSSSIMEYTSSDETRLLVPGYYDIAAIRFGYGDAVEMRNGEIRTLKDPQASIEMNVGVNTIRPFSYCDDYDAEFGNDPLCRRFDAGTNALEIVDHYINEYNTLVALSNYRYDDFIGMNKGRLLKFKRTYIFEPLLAIYNQWRLNLARYLGQDRKYLEKMDREEFTKKLAEMEKSPEFSKDFAVYRPAAKKIYAFFKQIAFLPDRFCLVTSRKDPSNTLDLISFAKLREDIYFKDKVSVRSCNDAATLSRFALDQKELWGETGFFLKDVRFDLSPQNLLKVGTDRFVENIDILGMDDDRSMAMGFLIRRRNDSYIMQAMDFYPNMMDEPSFREDMLTTVGTRIFEGILPKQIPNLDKLAQQHPEIKIPSVFPKFNSEAEILSNLFDFFTAGLNHPTDQSESQDRRAPVDATVIPSHMLNKPVPSIRLAGSRVFVASEDSPVGDRLIERSNELTLLKSATEISDENVEKTTEALKNLLPKKEVGKVSYADLLPFFNALTVRLKASSSSSEKEWLMNAFDRELKANQAGAKKVDKLVNKDKPTPEEVKIAAAQLDILKLFTDNKVTYDLYQDSVGEKLKTAQIEFNKRVRDYKDNSNEYDGQMKLLRNIMELYR